MIVVLVMYRSLSRTVAGQSRNLKALQKQYTYRRQEALSYETSSGVQEELHLGDLLVHVLHELNDEVHQLVLQHLLGVEIGDEERNVIALPNDQQSITSIICAVSRFNLHQSASSSR